MRPRSLRLRAFLACVAVALLPLVVVAIGPDGDAADELARLYVVTLPFAALLGLWLGWRIVRPVEELARRARAGAAAASPGGLALDRADEIGDLSVAIAALSDALVERARKNEAFAADLAHELKNPIAAVRAAAEALADAPSSPTSNEQADARTRRLAAALADASRRMDALVGDLLALARAEVAPPAAQQAPVDVAALVVGVVAARPDVDRFVVRTARAVVVGDAARLEGVVRELLDNAAAHAASRVTVDVGEHRADAVVRLVVEDDGAGIAADVLPRVFDRFFTTRGDKRGTGLGLAIVKATVEAQGGRVDVVSPVADGRGARFTVTLPAT